MATAVVLLTVMMAAFSSCSKTEDNEPSKLREEADAPYIKAANTYITANANAQVLEEAFESSVTTLFEASSSEKWCVAKVLYQPYRLQLSFAKNESASERKAVVTLKAKQYDMTASFNITQLAGYPALKFSKDDEGKDQYITASSQSWNWTLQSNLPYDDIEVQSDDEWCQVALADDDTATDMKNYQLTTTVAGNSSEQRRSAVVTISSKSVALKKSFKVTQNGSTITVLNLKVAFDRDGGSRQVTVLSEASWQAECDADWITLEQSEGSLTIHTTSTTDERTAKVTFKGREKPAITINQSKYKAGDAYDVDGVTGTVGYIGDEKRFIFKQLDEELQYRQYDDAGQEGATDMDDGRENTMKVLTIANKKDKKYPAFQAVVMLNTGGASGWYLPAINELASMKAFITGSAWSSTEAYVLSAYSHDGSSAQIINKTKKLRVYAVRQF